MDSNLFNERVKQSVLDLFCFITQSSRDIVFNCNIRYLKEGGLVACLNNGECYLYSNPIPVIDQDIDCEIAFIDDDHIKKYMGSKFANVSRSDSFCNKENISKLKDLFKVNEGAYTD